MRWLLSLFLGFVFVPAGMAPAGNLPTRSTPAIDRAAGEPDRDTWQRPWTVLNALDLKEDEIVADIGAGDGYFSRRFALRAGKVYVVESDPILLTSVVPKTGPPSALKNMVAVRAKPDDPKLLPSSVDTIFACDSLSRVPDRAEYLARLKKALRPGGRLVVIDFHKRPLPVGPPMLMNLSEEEMDREITAAGFARTKRLELLEYQYFLVYQPAEAVAAKLVPALNPGSTPFAQVGASQRPLKPVETSRFAWLEWLVFGLWVTVLLMFLCCLALIFFYTRTLRLDLEVSWFHHDIPSRKALRPMVLTLAVIFVCVLVMQFSDRESLVIQAVVAVSAAAVTSVFFSWAWSQAAAWTRRRSAEYSQWSARSEDACAEIRKHFDPPEIESCACNLLVERLGCTNAILYLKSGAVFRPYASAPTLLETEVSFSATALLCRELGRGLRFRPLALVDARTGAPLRWSAATPASLEAEQTLLASLAAHLAVPMQLGNSLVGFLLLGPRSGGDEYSPHHVRFAEAIARQTLVSLTVSDSARLAGERAAKEVEETAARARTRKIRGLLAPPDRLTLDALDLTAEYWAGTSAGGCFYDILALPDGSALVCLASVAGAEEEAAVRLVQLQAVLRGRAAAPGADLAAMIKSTSSALANYAAGALPIALFCARYDPATSTLQYVNAGHFPPILLRRTPEGASALRLNAGGAALGGPADEPLERGSLQLMSGDLLALVSEGVVTARNSQGEPWGEGRLIDTLLSWESQPARDIAHLTLHTVEEFTDKDPTAPARFIFVLRPQQRTGG